MDDRDGNLERARALAGRAAEAGAELVLFPELMSSGYTASARLWRAAESREGPTVRWLSRTSAELGMVAGTSYVELDGDEFFNTFVLTGSDGRELGRVRKTHAETYLFRGVRGSHVIDTPLGAVGVAVCADAQYTDVARALVAADVDLVLLPHAAPTAAVVGGMISAADVRRQDALLRGSAGRWARTLGVPAVFANQCGPTVGRPGLGVVGAVVDSPAFRLPGLSAIAEGDGQVRAQLEAEEDVIVAEVRTGLDGRSRQPLPSGPFLSPGPPTQRLLFGIDGALGRLHYIVRHRAAAARTRRRPFGEPVPTSSGSTSSTTASAPRKRHRPDPGSAT